MKAATRHKHTSEEKIRIVLEGFRREVAINELCRREGIKPHSYYAWTKEFMEAGKERLARDAVRDATQQEVQQLKRENGELKQLVADLSLEGYRLRNGHPDAPRLRTTPEAPMQSTHAPKAVPDLCHQKQSGRYEGEAHPIICGTTIPGGGASQQALCR